MDSQEVSKPTVHPESITSRRLQSCWVPKLDAKADRKPHPCHLPICFFNPPTSSTKQFLSFPGTCNQNQKIFHLWPNPKVWCPLPLQQIMSQTVPLSMLMNFTSHTKSQDVSQQSALAGGILMTSFLKYSLSKGAIQSWRKVRQLLIMAA